MKTWCVALLVAVVLSTTASAGLFGRPDWERDDCTDKHSFAWCFVHNMTKRPTDLYQYPDTELPADQYAAWRVETSGPSVSGSVALAAATGQLSGMGAVNGIKALKVSSMFKLNVLSSILTATDGNERFFSKIWLVADGTRPAADYEREFAAAWESALKQVVHFDYDGEIDYGPVSTLLGGEKQNVWHKVKADGCDEAHVCVATMGDSYFDDLRQGNVNTRSLPAVKWMPASKPLLINARDDLFPRGFARVPLGCTPMSYKPFRLTAGCEQVKLQTYGYADLIKLSALLPDYVWIWSPLDRRNPNVVPMLLNQGKAYFFVKPAIGQAASSAATQAASGVHRGADDAALNLRSSVEHGS
ncbi:MAG: hypothetical protein JO142_01950 [Burkholderiales bacterium]|nr:hypothetical protein [Burkholderiales bacterium]